MSTRRLIGRLSAVELLATGRTRTKTCSSRKGSDVRYFVLRRKYISASIFNPPASDRSVTHLPFKFAPRRQGKSKANLMTAVHYVSLLWRLMFKSADDKSSERPLRFVLKNS